MLTVPTVTHTATTIMEAEEEGIQGYLFQPSGQPGLFIAKDSADDIARFILFGEVPDNGGDPMMPVSAPSPDEDFGPAPQ